jgi:hypothetical protein
MKKIIMLFFVFIMLLSFAGCTVNSTTGSVTVVNHSDKDASNVKIGSFYIGYVAKGATTTVYFFLTQSAAVISVDKFEALSGAGTIDLKPDYIYYMDLNLTNSKYVFNCSAYPNGKEWAAMNSDKISMN